jgi:hypothetical protein
MSELYLVVSILKGDVELVELVPEPKENEEIDEVMCQDSDGIVVANDPKPTRCTS